MKAALKLFSTFLLGFVFSITSKIPAFVDPPFLSPSKILPEHHRIDYIFDTKSDFDAVSKQFLTELLESSVQVASYLLQDTFTALLPSSSKGPFCPEFDQLDILQMLTADIILIVKNDKNSKKSLVFEDCSSNFYDQKLGLIKINIPLLLSENEVSAIYDLVKIALKAYFKNDEILEKLDELFDTSLGASCTVTCKICNTNTGACVTCYDPTHMSIKNGVCYCTDPNSIFFPTTSSCVCKNGYYLNSTSLCAPCPSICATCSSLTSCLSCVSPSQMTLYNNWCYCSNPEGSVFNSATLLCNCPTGTWTNGQFCQTCNATCSTCSSEDVCTSCTDAAHMNLIGGVCSCKDPNAVFNDTLGLCECENGYYMGSTVCVPCQASCGTCSNGTFCDTCVDLTHMSLNDGKCTCSVENSYFNSSTQLCTCYNGSYMNGPSCANCQPPCGFCTNASTCISCIDSRMTLSNGVCTCPANSTFSMTQVSCVCNIGLFFNNSQVCIPCLSTCATCNNTSSCLSCIDPNHMYLTRGTCACTDPKATFNSTSLLCICPDGMYMGSSGYCISCPSACPLCTSPSNCLSCYSAASGYLPYTLINGFCSCTVSNSQSNGKNGCVCSDGYYQPPSQSQCLMCQGPCQNCFSTKTAIKCSSCVDPRMVLDNGYCQCSPSNSYYSPQLNSCQCNGGYYMFGFICSACSLPCETCSNSSLSCTSCILPNQMTLDSLNLCVCTNPSGSYYNLQLNQCTCPVKTYLNGTNCESCNETCMTCENSTECLTCADPSHMAFENGVCSCPENSTFTGNNCTCDYEFFWHGNECVECQPPCQQCVNQTTCISCFDSNNMILSNGVCTCKDPNALFDTAKDLCVCSNGYFSSNSICRACQDTCSTCQSNTACTNCIDQSHMTLSNGVCTCSDPNASFNSTQKICICNKGYQLANGVCITCPVQCSSCTANNVCIFCSNPQEMSVISGNCVCKASNTIYDPISNSCICKEKYYFNGNACVGCHSPMCSTCESNRCLSCIDIVNMSLSSGTCYCNDPNSFFNVTTGVCQCSNGYATSLAGNALECLQLTGPCIQYLMDGSCMECIATRFSKMWIYHGECYCVTPNMYYNTTLQDCYCNPGYYTQNNYQCIPFHINGCITMDGNSCTECVDSMEVSSGTCICKYGNYNSTLNNCTCSNEGPTYWNGNECAYCGCPSCSFDGNCLEACPQGTIWSNGNNNCICQSGFYACDDYNNCCSLSNTCTSLSNGYCYGCVSTMQLSNYQCNCQYPLHYNITINECQCPTGMWSSCAGCGCNYCSNNCYACISGSECTSCQPTFLLKNGNCLCDTNAQLVNSVCSCNNGFYMNSTYSCVPCIEPCATCTSPSFCTSCASDYIYASNGICICADTNAEYNSTTSQCECTVGYYNDSSSCVSCLATCYDCLEDGVTCTSCSDEKNMILNDGVCICFDPNAVFSLTTMKCECPYGYYNNVCNACGPSCSQCTDNQCLSCYDSAHMVLVGNSCNCLDPNAYYVEWAKVCACSSGFYNSGQICVPFPGLILNK